MHLCAASLASFILEYSLGANPMLHDIIVERIVVEDGMIAIPDRPGLGFTIKEDVVAKHAVRS
jgi:L-alanine-DL-glutamate epimerase-like enolase superfamily enzyme